MSSYLSFIVRDTNNNIYCFQNNCNFLNHIIQNFDFISKKINIIDLIKGQELSEQFIAPSEYGLCYINLISNKIILSVEHKSDFITIDFSRLYYDEKEFINNLKKLFNNNCFENYDDRKFGTKISLPKEFSDFLHIVSNEPHRYLVNLKIKKVNVKYFNLKKIKDCFKLKEALLKDFGSFTADENFAWDEHLSELIASNYN